MVIGIALVIGAALLLNRRAENQQVQQGPTPYVSPASTPEGHLANLPSPPASPGASPLEKPTGAEALVVLNDRSGTIMVDKAGNVFGLDDVPPPTRDAIARVLLTEEIEPPAILKNLASQESALRGSKKQLFKLISPTRSVITSDRPTFRWERVSGASMYRVYVNDLNGQEAARSEELSPGHTEWVVPKSLKRGEVYSWAVIAVIDGKEIVSPGSSSPEMRFQILSDAKLNELRRLKKSRSHLALAIFYTKTGMLADSERELLKLRRLNSKSKTVNKILRGVRALSESFRIAEPN